MNWIRSFVQEIQTLQCESKEIKVVELDEMHTYIGRKKNTVGSGLLLIDLEKDSS
ncbi:IS1 family transposase, partial [Elizabethkingia argentiflava]|nr:IS1 family transposase [Elizabethkingia argenteiflava]